jgi:DNA-binding transcriptional LysR family regulator
MRQHRENKCRHPKGRAQSLKIYYSDIQNKDLLMNASFRQLKLFLAVAEQRSITAAARLCHVTQPSVSMQLKELTDAVGLPLYEMVGKRLDLTPAGEALAETARNMASEWASFEQQIDAMKGLTRGRLRIAVVSTAKYFVPRILGSFCQRYPDIDIELEVQNRDGIVANLRANRNDLYIMSIPPDDIDIERHPFLPNPLVVIAPLNHPLARRKKLQLDDLAQERFILRERGSGTRTSCDAHFRSLGFTPRVRMELGSNEAIKQAVSGAMGISVLSQHALSTHLEDDQLTVLPVQGFPVRCSWWTLYPRGKRLSPIAQEFLRHLEASAAELRKRLEPAE